jgi:hypothetical protein
MPAKPVSMSDAAIYMVKRAGIDAACFLTTDEETIQLARNTYLLGKPKAQGMLDHFLKGTGTAIVVKTDDLFRDDPVLAAYFLAAVRSELKAGTTSGNVPVAQEVYGNQDWRNALGSINLQWKAVGTDVEVWFINRYRWHPKAKRVTQCVHEAANNLVAKGAAEFDLIGTHYTLTP